MTIEQDDQDIYDEVGAAFDHVHAPGDGAEAVLARGRVLRRRRRAMPAVAAACVVAAALGLGLTMTGGTGSSTVAAPTVRASVVPINVDTASYSVHTDPKTGYVTISLWRQGGADELRKVLADGGIASYFYFATVTPVPGKLSCTWIGGKEENSRSAFVSVEMDATSITVDPAKMPPGSAVVFQSLQFTPSATGPGYSGVAESGRFALLSAEPTGCAY
ncbi:hypothetical protein KDL01_05370 [Actinospica durhamensis]|uniref:Uncharacterized protein n=1 Tax=Actinospica durhamensis TaxID=1508375 RepID=A0A941IQ85_9ACTN|nr:hypothetical protein [Actinospica durhamensis]MBR7832678.1 hypothetical protein [Actinospica durhamensis]